jgi:hypothetical protein
MQKKCIRRTGREEAALLKFINSGNVDENVALLNGSKSKV